MTRFCDEWLLLPQRFALHEPSATAVLADVHLGYSKVRQQLGDAVPLRTVEEEMQPLIAAARVHYIQQLIVAGDLFERGYDDECFRRFEELLQSLHIRFAGLVPGNHDRGIETHAQLMPIWPRGFDLLGWQVCHGDQPVEAARAVMGHWHPAVRVKRRKQPCFMTRGTHLVLPAFSRDAAGVDVRAEARWRDWQSHWICGDEVRINSVGVSPSNPKRERGKVT